jgi:hypothetical protein
MRILVCSAGQSNSIGQGSGTVGAADLPQATQAWTLVFGTANDNGKLRPWHLFDKRQTFDIPGFGKEWSGTDMVCCRRLEDAGHTVTCLKVASGSSSLGENWELEWSAGRGYTSELVYQIGKAFASPGRPFDLGDYDLIVMLWDQSETDATNDALTTAYQSNLTDLFATVRAGAGLAALKGCIVQLHSSNPNTTRRGTIRTAQANFVAGDGGNSVLVDPSDLALDGDSLHRPAATRVTLGGRCATAILTL